MALRAEAWTLPGVGTFEQRFPIKDPVELSISKRLFGNGGGFLTLANSHSRANDILIRDPADPTSDVGSLMRVYNDGDWLFDWFADRGEESEDRTNPEITFSGAGLKQSLRHLDVLAKDYPASPALDPNWIFGAQSILDQFEDQTESVEIQQISVSGATGGTYTLSYDAGITNTNPIAYNETSAGTIESELEALSQVTDVRVSGTGTNTDPFLVEHIDPTDPGVIITANETLLTGPAPAVAIYILTPGGTLTTGRWTVSEDPATGIQHGTYNFFGMSTAAGPSPGGVDPTLRWDGTAPFGAFSYTGVQTIEGVVGGQTYHGGIYVYAVGLSSEIRVMVRNAQDEDELIASSTFPFTTVPANTWTWLPIDPFVMPTHVSAVIFRVATVDTTNPPPIHVAEPLLAPGVPAATIGDIMLQLLAHLATHKSAGGHLVPTFTALLDSNGVAWNTELSWDIGHGPDLEELMTFAEKWGYEWDVSTKGGTTVEFDIFNPAGAGTDLTADFKLDYRTGGPSSTNGRAVKAPQATDLRAEGPGGVWGESSDATLISKWGYRGVWWGDRTPRSSSELASAAGQRLADLTDAGAPVRVVTRSPSPNRVPGVDWNPGDIVSTEFPPRPQADRRVQGIAVTTNRQGTSFETHFGAIVYSERGAETEAVTRLVRKAEKIEPPQPKAAFFGGGGLTWPIIVAGWDSSPLWKSIAGFVCSGTSDEGIFQQAVDQAALEGRTLLAAPGGYFFTIAAGSASVVVPYGVKIWSPIWRIENFDGAYFDVSSGSAGWLFDLPDEASLENLTIDNQSGEGVRLTGSVGMRIESCSIFTSGPAVFTEAGNPIYSTTIRDSLLKSDLSNGKGTVDIAGGVDNGGQATSYSEGLRLFDNQRIQGGMAGLRILGDCWSLWVNRNSFVSNGDWSVLIDSSAASKASRLISIHDNKFEGLDHSDWPTTKGASVEIIGNATVMSAFVSIIGNQMNDNGTLVHLTDVERGLVASNEGTEPLGHGIWLTDCYRTTVAFNVIDGYGQDSNNSHDGIHLDGDTDECKIVWNDIEEAGAFTGRYGINVSAATCNGTVVMFNDLTNAATGTGLYNDAGTGTIDTVPAGAIGANFG